MAVTVSRLNGTTGEATSTGTSHVSGTVSPGGSRLIVVTLSRASGQLTGASSTFAITGSWTLVNTTLTNNHRISAAYAITSSSPGSGTVTLTLGATSSADSRIFVDEFSGIDTTTPVRQTKQGENTSTDGISGSFDSSPLSDSMLFAAVAMYQDSSGGTLTNYQQSSGWTAHESITAAFRRKAAHSTAAGSNGTGIGWTAGETLNDASFVALEIAAAAASGGHTKFSGKLGYPLRGKLG